MQKCYTSIGFLHKISKKVFFCSFHEKTKKGVVFVTHNIDEALAIADKILVIKKDKSIKEFIIKDDYSRDLGNSYYIDLKKIILNELGEE